MEERERCYSFILSRTPHEMILFQDGNMFVPFMQGMMQSLLSKEVLYPSLKDLVDKYPSWLAENKGKIEQSEYDR
jgi:hypothetical protein